MNPLFALLFWAGTALVILTLAATALGWISQRTAYGILALSQTVVGAGGFVSSNTTAASISTAGAALLAWQWWNGGGGDGTKRRLRNLARRFHGTRRTAPTGA